MIIQQITREYAHNTYAYDLRTRKAILNNRTWAIDFSTEHWRRCFEIGNVKEKTLFKCLNYNKCKTLVFRG